MEGTLISVSTVPSAGANTKKERKNKLVVVLTARQVLQIYRGVPDSP